jgi:zinc protease
MGAIVAVISSPINSTDAQVSKSGEPDQTTIFPFPVHRTQLPNGLTVISVEYDSPGVIAYYTVVRTGSRNEVEPGLSGFAHFFEHMMFRGTEQFSQEQYNDVLKALGADSNAFTSDDWTCYHITASKGALETIVELESDRFQNLKYSEADFQKEARAVLGEYNKSASSPFLLLEEKLQDTAFTKHTYKHTTIGFLRDIEDMPNQYSYSRKFFDRWYRPENCIVLVVGDVEHEPLVRLARKYYGAWKRGMPQIEIPREPAQTRENKLDLTWKGPTLPYLVLGYHVPGFDPKSTDIAALDVLAEAAFSETSPLYRKLVLEERTLETIYAEAPARRDPTLFTILARVTSVEHVDAVREEIYRTLVETAKSPIDPDRLDAIKSNLRYALAMSLDSADAVARTLGEYLQLTGDANSINQMYETYDNVTAKDVQRVAAQYFVPTNRTVITLRPERVGQKQTGSADLKFVMAELQSEIDSNLLVYHDPAASANNSDKSPKLAEVGTGSDRNFLFQRLLQKSGDESPNLKGAIRRDNAIAGETILRNDKSPLVAIRLMFHAGSKDDPAGREGLAALTARMLAEGGTKRYSYDEILQRLYPMAAAIGAHCDKEVTTFTGNVHRDKLAEFYDLFAEMLTAPRFDPDDFERLREEQLNFVSKILRGNDDEALGKWTLQLMLYPQHRYGHVDAGTVSGLRSIGLSDVKDFYQRHFAPISAKVQLGVSGGADAPFVAQARTDFRSLPVQPPADGLQPPHSPADLELTIVEKNCIATAISIGCPIDLTRADDDFYTLAVANSALGEHRTFNGRLMRNMRGKRGLNYGDYSYIENFVQDGGSTFPIPNVPRRQQYFSIWIRPVPHDKAIFALRQAIRELDLFVSQGIDEDEFEITRNFLLNYSKLWVQTQSRRLGYEMDGAFYGRSSLGTELDRRLPEITREQVNAAIKKYLQPRHLCVAVVTQDAESFRDGVLSRRPSPLHYDTQGTPPEILQEDKLIDVYPLPVNRDRLRIISADQMFE